MSHKPETQSIAYNNVRQVVYPLFVALCAFFCLFSFSPAQADNDGEVPLANRIYPRFLFAIEKFYQERFDTISGIFVDKASGEIYAADSGRNEIFIFDKAGEPLFRFGRESGVSSPIDVAVRDGNIYLSQADKNYLEVFNYRGESIKKIMPEGIRFSPGGLSVDETGDLYVINKSDGGYLVLDRKDALKLATGKKVSSIAGIAAYKGEVFVLAPFDIPSIHVYDKKGEYIRGFGASGGWEGEFGLPSAIQADKRGILWVADALKGFSALSRDGKRILDFANYSKEKGGVYFPIDIDFDDGNNVYLAEKSMRRISVFSTGK